MLFSAIALLSAAAFTVDNLSTLTSAMATSFDSKIWVDQRIEREREIYPECSA